VADTLPDLERFVRGFALFQRRFLNEADVAAAQRPPAGTAAASAAAAPRTALPPAPGLQPRRTA
jgi:hypothetical protein